MRIMSKDEECTCVCVFFSIFLLFWCGVALGVVVALLVVIVVKRKSLQFLLLENSFDLGPPIVQVVGGDLSGAVQHT